MPYVHVTIAGVVMHTSCAQLMVYWPVEGQQYLTCIWLTAVVYYLFTAELIVIVLHDLAINN